MFCSAVDEISRRYIIFPSSIFARYFYLIYIYGLICVLSQSIKDPLNRKAYVVENQPITLTWSIDFNEKEIEFARWAIAKADNVPYQVMVSYTSLEKPNFVKTSLVEDVKKFGEITLKSPKQEDIRYVDVSINFKGINTPLKDSVEFIYVANTPFVNTQLPAYRNYVENQGELTNQKFTFNVMGRNLLPIIIWRLNGENITQFNSFSISRNISEGIQVVEETLTIAQILPYCNGILSAEARYGNETDFSVNVISETRIQYKYSPKYVGIATNITGLNQIVYTETGMRITCESTAEPYVTYQFIIAGDIERTSSNGTFEYTVRKYYSALYLTIQCFVFNELGNATSDRLAFTVQNRTAVAQADSDVNWMTYFLVGCVVALVALVGVSGTLCVVRSRMRSMNIKHEANKLRERSLTNRTDYENKAMRHNGSSHVYDLNQRGRPDGTQRTNTINGIENDGFGLYDEF